MSLMMYLYLCSVVPNIGAIFTLTLVLLIIGTLVTFAMNAEDLDREYNKGLKKMLKRSCIAIPILAILAVAIPNEKTMYMMGGAYAVQKVVDNPKVQALNDKILEALNAKLDEVLDTKKKDK